MTLGANNPEIQSKIDELFSAIMKEQSKVNGVKPADSDKTSLVETLHQEYTPFRGKGFFYKYLTEGQGNGPFTKLSDGSVKYDLIGGIGVGLLGHSHPLYVKSCLEAATKDVIMCGNLMPYRDALELNKTLVSAVSEKSRLRHFWYAGSGSFANDLGLKVIWQKKAPAYKIIAFSKAFHGRSVATQDLTDKPEYREGMPKFVDVEYAPHFDHKDPKGSLDKTLKALDTIWAKDPDGYACIFMEVVQGEAGFVYGTKDYYKGVFEWAKKKGIYIWVDEVQSFGRTHELFAYQMFELDEYIDMVTIGKALQCCGIIYTEELDPKPGLIAGTFNGSLASINAGINTLNFLLNGGFYGDKGKNAQIEQKFIKKFEELTSGDLKSKIPYFGAIGTMISFEVGDSGKDVTNNFVKKLFDNGIVAFIAGKEPVRVRFLLPVSLTDHHIDEIFAIIKKTAEECL